uniref:Uncharacterized protein n=1 Tax=Anopheles melas TaxID=34690 RepID=A0A182TUG5_9DIPT
MKHFESTNFDVIVASVLTGEKSAGTERGRRGASNDKPSIVSYRWHKQASIPTCWNAMTAASVPSASGCQRGKVFRLTSDWYVRPGTSKGHDEMTVELSSGRGKGAKYQNAKPG